VYSLDKVKVTVKLLTASKVLEPSLITKV
jgi:hypothetical protein